MIWLIPKRGLTKTSHQKRRIVKLKLHRVTQFLTDKKTNGRVDMRLVAFVDFTMCTDISLSMHSIIPLACNLGSLNFYNYLVKRIDFRLSDSSTFFQFL